MVVKKLETAFRKALEDEAVIETLKRYEMFPKFMDSAAYTRFVADYMVSERENLTKIGFIKPQ